MNNTTNNQSYLRTSRYFPEDPHQLSVECNKAYVDTSNAVNSRMIGTFPANRSVVTGESWYLTGSNKKQTIRQVYPFTSTANIPHGINTTDITGFTRLFGSYSDGTNFYGLISGSNVAIAGQLSFYLTPINIVFVVGAGSPAVTSGRLVLEWLSSI